MLFATYSLSGFFVLYCRILFAINWKTNGIVVDFRKGEEGRLRTYYK